ncbi:hypothetical protein H2200_001377 [Cladophialophora chaetospira]|uniref:Major facilitator superfamily (MFS) profile domain-containing protein n=1 Tax=Cladophialophora chaetospira TaxID=386627 RepID=A0AA38XKS5_9EURO|nr:hypothetical protein H2200_001377 [Cladophialophora chaetospira]
MLTSFSLTQGTFVLVSGRLGAVFGHKNMLFLGGSVFTIFTLINGFVPNYIAFNAIRALSGIGGALILPNAVAMIAITNPPGRWRNLSLGFFGASAPIGGFIGGMYIGLLVEYSEVKWFFVGIAAVAAIVFVSLWTLGPKEVPVDRHGKFDYIGALLGTSALIIFNYVWNQAPAVGWAQPLEYTLLLVSVLLFGLFIAWEARTPHPIMPLAIYKAPSFGALLLVVLLNYMSMGTILWYMLLWQQNIRHWSVLHTAIGWSPFIVVATLGSLLAAWLVPRVAAQWIVAIGTVTAAISSLLLATMPRQQIYWAQMFPATVFMALCPDLTFTAAQIIASNAVRRHEQGVAGSLIGTLNLYGNSLGLGFAATVESRVAKDHGDTLLGYRSALFFGLGISLVALLIDVFFVRLVKDEREGWDDADDEDEESTETLGRRSDPDHTPGVELRRVAQVS